MKFNISKVFKINIYNAVFTRQHFCFSLFQKNTTLLQEWHVPNFKAELNIEMNK